MKTKIIVIGIILSFLGCNNQTSFNQVEKDKLSGEIELVLNSMRDGMHALNPVNAFAIHTDTSMFKYIGIHGEMMGYVEFIKEAKNVFSPAKKVEFSFSNNDVRILSPNIAIATYQFNGTFFFEESKLSFPNCGVSIVLWKKDGNWKMIQMHESVQESEFKESKIESTDQ